MAPLDDAIEIYGKAILALEEAAPNPTFEQIVEALVARDSIEKKKQMDQNPVGGTYAKLIELDARLKAMAETIANDDRLEDWKASINPPPTSWWWSLKYPLPRFPYQAIARYQNAIAALEEAESEPAPEQLLEVLIARDEIDEAKNNKPFTEPIAKLVISLDERLKALGELFAKDDKLYAWRESLKPLPQNWWWDIKNFMPLSPNKAIERYADAIVALEETSPNRANGHLLEALQAREAVAEALRQSKLPAEKMTALVELDERLKRQGEAIACDDTLEQWKKTLGITAPNWWWQLTDPEPLPAQAMERYDKALCALEIAASDRSSEQIIEVLLARDAVEKTRASQKQPPPDRIAQLFELDSRLKALSFVIVADDTLEEWKKSLSVSPQNWWWGLTDSDPLPYQAIARYEKALIELENPPSPTTEELLEVLLARDTVEKAQSGQKQPPPGRIAKIIHLDNRLKAQAQAFAADDTLDEWKNSLKPPQQNWWWGFTKPIPLPNQAIERYDAALKEVERANHPSAEQLLEALLARDGVENAVGAAWPNQPVPEKIAKQIIKLDQRLKKYRLALNQDNQLVQWKSSLKRTGWWWDLKPALLGSEDEPATGRDWVLTGLALLCLGIAGSFVVNTYNIFSKPVTGVKQDLAQNLATILQVVGLGAAAGGAATKKGQETIEKMIVGLRMPPNLQAPAALGISVGLLGVTGGLNASLPFWGEKYIEHGQKLLSQGELIKARENFLQATKFINSAEAEAKIAVGLGEIAEDFGDLPEAKIQYQKGRQLNDPAAINALGKLMILEQLQKKGWTSKIDPTIARESEFLFAQALQQMTKQLNQKAAALKVEVSKLPLQEQNFELQSKINTNFGIWGITTADLTKKPDPEALKLAVSDFQRGVIQEVLVATGKELTPEELDKTNLGTGRARCFYRLGQLLYAAFGEGKTGDELKAADTKVGDESCYNGPAPIDDLDIYEASLVYFARRVEGLPKNPSKPKKVEASPAPAAANPTQPPAAPADASEAMPKAIAPAELEELRLKLFDQIQDNWLSPPTFDRTLIYRVKVDKDGAIAAVEPVDQLATDFLAETSLPVLPKSNDPSAAIAQFKVAFSPSGTFEVSQWQE